MVIVDEVEWLMRVRKCTALFSARDATVYEHTYQYNTALCASAVTFRET